MKKDGNIQNLKSYKAGETGNPNGRPRKLVTQVIAELKAKGIENVKPINVVDLLEVLMNCDIKTLQELAADENQTWLTRQTAKNMLKSPEKAWMDVQDRAHGKAMQKQEIKVDNNVIRVTISGEVPKPDIPENAGEGA